MNYKTGISFVSFPWAIEISINYDIVFFEQMAF
jgi:hypothetical protein